MANIASMKKCSRCKCRLSLKRFGKNAANRDGHQTFCKACAAEQHKRYYAENKERLANYALTRKMGFRRRDGETPVRLRHRPLGRIVQGQNADLLTQRPGRGFLQRRRM